MSIAFLFGGLRVGHTQTQTLTNRDTNGHADTHTHNNFTDKSYLKKSGAHGPAARKYLI